MTAPSPSMAPAPLAPMSNANANTMASTTPASPTLTGIPMELKHLIFEHLITTGEVSGRMFLKKHKDEYSGDLLLQFMAATAISNSLSITCHQLRAEFSLFHATTVKARHVFVVNNLDPEQLLLFRTFLATYRLSHQQHSDSTIPLRLFQNVTLCLELDDNIDQSVAAYHKTLVRYHGHGIVPEAFDGFSEVVVRSKFSSYGYGKSTGRGKSTSRSKRLTGDSEAQAILAAIELRSIYQGHSYHGHLCRGPDRIAVRSIMEALATLSGRSIWE
jgi:hypothetical protein